jgi:hypothetical protein
MAYLQLLASFLHSESFLEMQHPLAEIKPHNIPQKNIP